MDFSTEGLENLVTSEDAEINGIRVHIDGPVYFIIRRAGGANTAYERARAKYSRMYRRQLERMGDPEVIEKILMPAYLDEVIVGWEGVKDASGKDVPYTKQACKAWFKAFPNAWDDIFDISQSVNAFLQSRLDEAAEVMGEASGGG